ncbi:dNA polymerase III subunit gamma and tau [Clostridium sp. CAG:1013]|nr:dNA polymerase III subunit gamma and tau [Clostridium sp. CAG:1013]
MYKVLYRKYRPQFFADVVGQPQVTVTLKNELMRGRIAHAYLFTGSRGTGKTTCAKILARAVNCLHPKDGDPCGECEVCRGLEEGSILDVVEIDAASNNGVDSIRSLIEESNFTPTTAKYRVYIIDEVHMLSIAAFNALLKTLEEPPPHVIFILATTEVHKLLPTILSRCQRFDFRRIAPEDIAERLEDVASKEDAQLDQDAALLIARIADGALRDALSLLDQCLGRDRHVTLEVVNQTAGVAARDYLASLAQDIVEQNPAHALEAIDGLHRESKDMNRLCEEMAEYFRGLMLIKTMKDASRLVLCSPQELELMTSQALSMNLSAILHGLDTFEETLHKMRYANQRAELEMAFVKLCNPQLDTSPEALLRRLEALENGAPRVIPAPAAETPAPQPQQRPAVQEEPPAERTLPPEAPTKEEPAPAAASVEQPVPEEDPFREKVPSSPPPQENKPTPKPRKKAPVVDVEALSAGAQRFRDWPEILQRIRGDTKSVAMAFAGSAAYVNGDYMLIQAPELAFELLKRPEQRDRMREAIRQVTGRVYKLGPYREPQEETPAEADPFAELERRAKEEGIELRETAEPVRENTDEEELPPLTDAEIPF